MFEEILNEEIKQDFSKFKKLEIPGEDKEDLEINTKYKTSTDSQNESENEENNIDTIYQEFTNKFLFPEYNYFFCNEKYIKEKFPEGNNYKISSRNYIKKMKQSNEIKMEESNKKESNNILNDLENLYAELKNENNKFDSNNLEQINFNLSELSNAPSLGEFDLNSKLFCPYIYSNINCKYLLIII
jgi:hypothetical protein